MSVIVQSPADTGGGAIGPANCTVQLQESHMGEELTGGDLVQVLKS